MKKNSDEDGSDTCRPKLQKRSLKGHSSQVTCLAHSSERASPDDTSPQHHPSLLLSGSEDGTGRCEIDFFLLGLLGISLTRCVHS